MSYPSEQIRIIPLCADFSTAASTGGSIGKTRYTGGDLSVICGVRASTVTSTGQTSTAAMNYDFSVLESTAATANGSVITGATMTLGAATAFVTRGAVALVCKVASDLATAVNLVVNGITYHTTAVGATGENGVTKLAKYINGTLGSNKLPHYTAIGSYSSANLMLITGDDDMGTGITAVTVTGGVQTFLGSLQGCIDIAGSKLSTNSPKYIGVACTSLTGSDTSIRFAHVVTRPTVKPAMSGVIVSCTT